MFKETLGSLQGVRLALVIVILIYILLLFGSINTSIANNDQFENNRIFSNYPACMSAKKMDQKSGTRGKNLFCTCNHRCVLSIKLCIQMHISICIALNAYIQYCAPFTMH